MPKLSSYDKIARLKRLKVTRTGYAQMRKKLDALKLSRPDAVKELARARELGDLSENGLYTAAKARLNSIDSQIFKLEMTLKLSDIVNVKKTNIVQIGSKITVLDEKKIETYEIVGDLEANPKENKISQNSPMGKSLLGKSTGEVVIFQTPSLQKTIKILEILNL